jgi:maltose alpha-D-glucosyltransferase / alpha-amylase
VEITRFLSERQRFPHIPPYAGSVEFRSAGGESRVLALALGLVPNEGDAWVFTLGEVAKFFERVRQSGERAAGWEAGGLLDDTQDPEPLVKLAGSFAGRVRQLGERTGQMHRALAADATDPAFAPEPFTAEDLQKFGAALRSSIEQLFTTLRERSPGGADVARLLGSEGELLRRAQAAGGGLIRAAKARTHGDYHLGQVLNTGSDFVIIDFEGEPQRSLAFRKEKRSPLRDVAGMLRSFHYAAHSGLGEVKGGDPSTLKPWAEAWAQWASRTFLRGWLESTAGAPFVPASRQETRLLLEAFLLEKAIYEVGYELNNRPAWVGIPIAGILQILDAK